MSVTLRIERKQFSKALHSVTPFKSKLQAFEYCYDIKTKVCYFLEKYTHGICIDHVNGFHCEIDIKVTEKISIGILPYSTGVIIYCIESPENTLIVESKNPKAVQLIVLYHLSYYLSLLAKTMLEAHGDTLPVDLLLRYKAMRELKPQNSLYNHVSQEVKNEY